MARPPIRAPTLRVYVRRGTRRGRAWPSWPRSTQGRVLLCLRASSGFGPPAWGRGPGQANQPTNCAVADGWIEQEPIRPRVELGTERNNVRRHLFFRVKKGPRGILFLHWTPLCCFSDTPMTRDLRRSILKRMQLWVARHEKWFIFEQVFSE